MLQTITKKTYTFEEYLEYYDDTDLKYELVNGELIPMPPASGLHALILVFMYNVLQAEIKRLKLDWTVMPGNIGVRTAQNKSRIPDLAIITESQRQELREMTSAVLQYPPLLAVEIVSPGNAVDDYRYKQAEYAVREIPEYWIVDPVEAKVFVLKLVDGLYEPTEFSENQEIKSSIFPELTLTVEQVLNADN
jgi:Uma2 family endonuclease